MMGRVSSEGGEGINVEDMAEYLLERLVNI